MKMTGLVHVQESCRALIATDSAFIPQQAGWRRSTKDIRLHESENYIGGTVAGLTKARRALSPSRRLEKRSMCTLACIGIGFVRLTYRLVALQLCDV